MGYTFVLVDALSHRKRTTAQEALARACPLTELWRAHDAASLPIFVSGCIHRAHLAADALNLTETLSYCQKWAYSER